MSERHLMSNSIYRSCKRMNYTMMRNELEELFQIRLSNRDNKMYRILHLRMLGIYRVSVENSLAFLAKKQIYANIGHNLSDSNDAALI